MKLRLFFIILVALVLLLLPSLLWAWQGKVVHVTDGDTIVVLTEDKEQVRIRLYGIDAPESGQPFGRVATRYVRDIAALEIVEIDEKYMDRYGRTIATELFTYARRLSPWRMLCSWSILARTGLASNR